MRIYQLRPASSGWMAPRKTQPPMDRFSPEARRPDPVPDESLHLPLKSRFSGPVIKMWQAAARASVRRHAPCLVMSFNHRMGTLQPTQGSLSVEDEQSDDSPIKILYLFLSQR